MTPQQSGARQYKRLLAVAGATIVVAGGTIGLAFASDSDDTAKVPPVTTAPAAPTSDGAPHYPSPPPPCDEGKGPNYC